MSRKFRSKEMAEQLGVSLRTLRHWQASGFIPFIKIRQTILFEAEKVQAALERFEQKATIAN
jgi:excisionase family DNA binding protein